MYIYSAASVQNSETTNLLPIYESSSSRLHVNSNPGNSRTASQSGNFLSRAIWNKQTRKEDHATGRNSLSEIFAGVSLKRRVTYLLECFDSRRVGSQSQRKLEQCETALTQLLRSQLKNVLVLNFFARWKFHEF